VMELGRHLGSCSVGRGTSSARADVEQTRARLGEVGETEDRALEEKS